MCLLQRRAHKTEKDRNCYEQYTDFSIVYNATYRCTYMYFPSVLIMFHVDFSH